MARSCDGLKRARAPCHATVENWHAEDCGGAVQRGGDLRLCLNFEFAVWRDRAGGVLCGVCERQGE